MRKVYSETAGATFHRETPHYTFCFLKTCIEFIYKMSPGEYIVINMTHVQNGELLLFTNWGTYFNRLQNPDVQMPRVEKTCPTLYKVMTGEDPDNVNELSFEDNGHVMHGLGMNHLFVNAFRHCVCWGSLGSAAHSTLRVLRRHIVKRGWMLTLSSHSPQQQTKIS